MPPCTDLQFGDLNRADRDAHELQNLAADRFHHPPHLAIASLVDL
jgi:hypothetical protein